MIIQENKIDKYIAWLLIISALLRGFFAAYIELGNDEVYYWTYAMYPDWSHFDHPGMVGWVIQLFSLNLMFTSEFALRLSSVLFATINTYLIYRLGSEIKNKLAGFYAALLYTSSLYVFVMIGVFILPDTPLNLFLLLSIYCFIRSFKEKRGEIVDRSYKRKKNIYMVLGGFFAGLAMLSKYSAFFIWVGVGLYVLFYDRKQFKNIFIYISGILTILCTIPIMIWNIQNKFISFTFHGDRVDFSGHIQPKSYLVEILGEIGYNNPVNFVLVIIALVALLRGARYLDKMPRRFLLLFALPFVGLFWYFSLTRPILPHWSAPAVTMLLLFPASYLADKHPFANGKVKLPKSIVAALSILLFVLTVGTLEIKTGIVPLNLDEKSKTISNYGDMDVTASIYGWRSIKDDFQKIREKRIAEGSMNREDAMIGLKWFPMANFDYYVAHPLGIKMLGLREVHEIHKYAWINGYRGGFKKGANYWFLNDSSDYYDPEEYLYNYFDRVTPCDTITVDRCGKPAKYIFVYMCKGLK